MTTESKIENAPATKKARRKLILNGVSISSLAKVRSSGIVALKANIAPIWTITKTSPASSKNLILLKISIGSASGEPTSNRTRCMPAITKANKPAETNET